MVIILLVLKYDSCLPLKADTGVCQESSCNVPLLRNASNFNWDKSIFTYEKIIASLYHLTEIVGATDVKSGHSIHIVKVAVN